MKKLHFLTIFFLVIGSNCVNSSQQRPEQKPESNVVNVNQETKKDWEYKTVTDQMTSKPMNYAGVVSDNTLDFDFPYQGGSTGNLMIRQKDGKDEVLLTISKGQFLGAASGRRQVSLRFDEQQPFSVTFTQPSDYSSTLIFLDNEAKIISELKKASKLKVEAEFYQEGKRILEFTVKDFKW